MAFFFPGVADVEETIAAVATAPGEAALAIVRVSGPEALPIVARVFRPERTSRETWRESHRVSHGWVLDEGGRELDEVLVVVMRAPRTYTREDVVEIGCHGGVAVSRGILRALLEAGARLAAPGEFTRRAFLNGRMDLTQVEAVMDLISSRTRRSARAAAARLAGKLAERVREARRLVFDLLAELEARIDFPEEGLGELPAEWARETLQGIRDRVGRLLATAGRGRALREGVRTVLAGRPNVGKSSLLNALLGEDRAIVSEIAGTTRDYLEENLSIGGVPLVLVDTAGIGQGGGPLDQLGVERARRLIREADLVVVVLDDAAGLRPEDREILALLKDRPCVVALNKADLGRQAVDAAAVGEVLDDAPVVRVSAATGQGLKELEEAVQARVGLEGPDEAALVGNLRQEAALRRGLEALDGGLEALREERPWDLVAVDLREAYEALGEVTGESGGADLVAEIFSRFCIGK